MGDSSELDVVGVGLGPANLALVTALLDARDERRGRLPRAVFFEQSSSFAWHPGMMLAGSRLQVPFLKDLVLQRNPRSRYSFLNYLFEQGRLEQFINLRELNPEREEFDAYMRWVCGHAEGMIRFGHRVAALRWRGAPHGDPDQIEIETSCVADGAIRRYAARAVVIAVGRRPRIPEGVSYQGAERITHASHFLPWLERMRARRQETQSILVVGGGQSAAEVACHLLREHPGVSVELCHRRFVLHAIDDNPLLNEAYFGGAVADFHGLSEEARQRALHDLAASNFSVIDRPILEELYRHQYRGLLESQQRVSLLRGHALLRARDFAGRVHCVLRNCFTGDVIERIVDGLVLATGYSDAAPALLDPLTPWLKKDAGGFALRRDYRVDSDPAMRAAVFLHGSRESVHGPGEYNLSSLAQRAQVLSNALTKHLECAESQHREGRTERPPAVGGGS